jgi:hypothetical protein
MPDLKQLEQELKDVQREVRNLTVMGLRPGLSAEKAENFKLAERSARAECKLRYRALQKERARQNQK